MTHLYTHNMSLLRNLWNELDTYYRYGWCMSAWFAVAAEMYWRGMDIPSDWNYSPGAARDPREPDAPEYLYCLEASNDELRAAGNVLARYARMLKHAGKDY